SSPFLSSSVLQERWRPAGADPRSVQLEAVEGVAAVTALAAVAALAAVGGVADAGLGALPAAAGLGAGIDHRGTSIGGRARVGVDVRAGRAATAAATARTGPAGAARGAQLCNGHAAGAG